MNIPEHAGNHEMYMRRLNLGNGRFEVIDEIIGIINKQIDLANLRPADFNSVTCHTRRLSETVKGFIGDYYKLFGWSEVEWKGRIVNLKRKNKYTSLTSG